MKYPVDTVRTRVHIQPVLHLVDFFEESTEYDRHWKLPFNSLSLCVRENPRDPSWIELPEKGSRIRYEAGITHFTTVETPMRIRYTTANRHFCIHFRYELFPGVDLFSGLHERYIMKDKNLAQKIKAVFAEPDPVKRLAGAEAIAMEIILRFWPEKLPIELEKMERFAPLLRYVNTHLDSRLGIPEMASFMGWSEAYFSRTFRSVFRITPKQYLVRELFARAMSLLNHPQKSIKEISDELKFSSEFNFSRFIRHYSGHSPSELRSRHSGPLYVRK